MNTIVNVFTTIAVMNLIIGIICDNTMFITIAVAISITDIIYIFDFLKGGA